MSSHLTRPPTPTPAAPAARFVEAINAHNADDLALLMTEDHTFVDSVGKAMHGREAMRAAWMQYFAFVPDYRVEIRHAAAEGDTAALFGTASGTFVSGGGLREENRWSIPAAWRATIRAGKVAEWQVYCDFRPLEGMLRRLGM